MLKRNLRRFVNPRPQSIAHLCTCKLPRQSHEFRIGFAPHVLNVRSYSQVSVLRTALVYVNGSNCVLVSGNNTIGKVRYGTKPNVNSSGDVHRVNSTE